MERESPERTFVITSLNEDVMKGFIRKMMANGQPFKFLGRPPFRFTSLGSEYTCFPLTVITTLAIPKGRSLAALADAFIPDDVLAMQLSGETQRLPRLMACTFKPLGGLISH